LPNTPHQPAAVVETVQFSPDYTLTGLLTTSAAAAGAGHNVPFRRYSGWKRGFVLD
jgi:hypothetical protein